MKELHQQLSLKTICSLFGKSRQGWYYLDQHRDDQLMRTAIVLHGVREIRSHLKRLGGIKIRHKLQELDPPIAIGRDRLYRVLRENDLLIKPRRKYTKTTNSHHHFRIWPDLVQRARSEAPEQIWVSDITHIQVKSKTAYLSLVTDAYSRKIVGYYLSRNLKAEGSIIALNMALNSRIYPQQVLIHHSDRGIQYCCADYIKVLKANNLTVSMTQNGSPYDNAIAERVNGILKIEFQLGENFLSFVAARQQVADAIHKYNRLRPHFSCDLQTPQYRHAAFHQVSGKVNKGK